jgi:microcystin-dependent protein
MAVLTSSGVTFSDSTTISSKYDVIPQSDTPLYFYQSSAPSGWSQVTSNDNKAMRVVSGTGAGTGGSNSFTGTFTNRTYSANFNVPFSAGVNNHTLTTAQLPSHSHPTEAGDTNATGAGPAGNVSAINSGTSNSGGAGNSGGHSHPASVSASAGWSAGIDMRVQYINVIYCTFS